MISELTAEGHTVHAVELDGLRVELGGHSPPVQLPTGQVVPASLAVQTQTPDEFEGLGYRQRAREELRRRIRETEGLS